MKLNALTVWRMPGIDDSFTLEGLSPGLNIVVGPNGTGKSTVRRAIQSTLWPSSLPLSVVDIESSWDDHGTELVALQHSPGRTRWQREGVECEIPDLPESRFAHCFAPALQALVVESDDDAALAMELARQITGGYDLGRLLAEETGMQLQRGHGANESRAVARAEQTVFRIQSQHEALADRESELEELHTQRDQARAAAQLVTDLEATLRLIDLRGGLEKAMERVDVFPDEMKHIAGDEAERVSELRASMSRAESRAATTRRDIERLDQQIAALGLDSAIEDADMREVSLRISDARIKESEIAEAKKGIAELEATAQGAAKKLTSHARGITVEPGSLDPIASYLQDAERARAEKTRIETELSLLEQPWSGPALNTLRDASSALRAWLSSPVSTAVSSVGMWATVVVLALGLAGVGIALAILTHPAWATATAAAVLGLVAYGVIGRMEARSTRRDHEQRYAATRVPAPTSWSIGEVGAKLQELERQIAQAELCIEHEGRRTRLERELVAFAQKNAALGERRTQLKQMLGLAEHVTDLSIAQLGAELSELEGARQALRTAKASLKSLESARDEAMGTIRAFLTRHGGTAIDDGVRASVLFEDLRARNEQRRSLDAKRAELAIQLDETEARINERKARIEEIFAKVHIHPDHIHVLRDRIARLDEYRVAVQRLERALGAVEQADKAVVHRPELKELSAEVAAERLAKAKKTAATLEDLTARIVALENEVRLAREGDALETALERLHTAEEDLRDRYDDALFAKACDFMVGHVARQHEDKARPLVLKRAQELFSTFTHYGYELKVDLSGAKPSFQAVDTASGQLRALGELSDGTRAQLLLATRLAFAAQEERTTPVPFLLDEVLTTTDPSRFQAIVESLLALVRNEDRQIVYFTSQPVDIERFRKALRSPDEMKVVDLAGVRKVAAAAPPERIVPPPAEPEVTPPGQMPPAQYAQIIGVPRFRPQEGPDAQHLFYMLTDDLPLLHTLLRARIDSLGPLKSLLRANRGGGLLDDKQLATVQARAAVLDSFISAWQVGRGRPVTREVLVEAGVRESFLDRVAALAEEVGGDAQRLLEELRNQRVRGFLRSHADQLEHKLKASGYLDTRPPLGREALRTQVIGNALPQIDGRMLPPGKIAATCDWLWDNATPVTVGAAAVAK